MVQCSNTVHGAVTWCSNMVQCSSAVQSVVPLFVLTRFMDVYVGACMCVCVCVPLSLSPSLHLPQYKATTLPVSLCSCWIVNYSPLLFQPILHCSCHALKVKEITVMSSLKWGLHNVVSRSSHMRKYCR